MKRLIKVFSSVFILSVIIVSIVVVYAAENNLEFCDHSYCYSKTIEDSFMYYCSKCGSEEAILISEVKAKWNVETTNKRSYDIENGYILDVVQDGFVNAKDYAKIQHSLLYGY